MALATFSMLYGISGMPNGFLLILFSASLPSKECRILAVQEEGFCLLFSLSEYQANKFDAALAGFPKVLNLGNEWGKEPG
jgi:hypothetical protein